MNILQVSFDLLHDFLPHHWKRNRNGHGVGKQHHHHMHVKRKKSKDKKKQNNKNDRRNIYTIESNMESNISNMTKKVSKIERMYDSGKRLKQKILKKKKSYNIQCEKVSKRETNNT
eukprot:UN04307